MLDETSEQEEAGRIGHAGGLLHVVRHDHDGALFLQRDEKVFDLRGGDGVERGTGLVEQQNFGVNGEGARNAQSGAAAGLRKARTRIREACL